MAADVVDKLSKVLCLLGSNHDGEVLNAAHKATELLKKNNITWEDVLSVQPEFSHEQLQRVFDAGFKAGEEHGRKEAIDTAAAPAWRPVTPDLWPDDPLSIAPHLGEVIDKINEIWAVKHRLSNWEATQFLPSICEQICRRSSLSPKQLSKVDTIYRQRVSP